MESVTSRSIAAALGVSADTTGMHVKNLYTKLGAHDRTQDRDTASILALVSELALALRTYGARQTKFAASSMLPVPLYLAT